MPEIELKLGLTEAAATNVGATLTARGERRADRRRGGLSQAELELDLGHGLKAPATRSTRSAAARP